MAHPTGDPGSPFGLRAWFPPALPREALTTRATVGRRSKQTKPILTSPAGSCASPIKLADSLAWSVAAGKTFDDFTLDVRRHGRWQAPDDNDYGVCRPAMDDQNFYRFEIMQDGY